MPSYRTYFSMALSGNQPSRMFSYCNTHTSIPLDCMFGIQSPIIAPPENLNRIINSGVEIDNFIANNGKFIYASTSYNKYSSPNHSVGHINNSIHLPSNDLQITSSVNTTNCNIKNILLPAQLVNVTLLNQILSNSNISKQDLLCVYCDSSSPTDASFVFYMLYKLNYNVYYLNFDWTTLDYTTYRTSLYPRWNSVNEFNQIVNNTNITADALVQMMANPLTKIIDVRPLDQYNGTVSIFTIPGHIAGSINIPYTELFVSPTNSNTFKSKGDILTILNSAGITETNNIIVSCNTGRLTSSMFFAIKFILQWPNIFVFEGSFNLYQQLYQICPSIYPVTTTP